MLHRPLRFTICSLRLTGCSGGAPPAEVITSVDLQPRASGER